MGELYRLDFANGKSYIGVTEKTSLKRFKGHSASAKNMAKSFVYNVWRKYGEPKLVVLAIVENSLLMEIEIKAIEIFGTLVPNGCNSTPGGDFNPSKIDWINKKKSESLKGRKISESTRKSLSLANIGRKLTEEHKRKLSEAGKGKAKSEEHRKKIGESNIGRVNSAESIEKMRAALKGRKNPDHAKRMKGNQNWKFRNQKEGEVK